MVERSQGPWLPSRAPLGRCCPRPGSELMNQAAKPVADREPVHLGPMGQVTPSRARPFAQERPRPGRDPSPPRRRRGPRRRRSRRARRRLDPIGSPGTGGGPRRRPSTLSIDEQRCGVRLAPGDRPTRLGPQHRDARARPQTPSKQVPAVDAARARPLRWRGPGESGGTCVALGAQARMMSRRSSWSTIASRSSQ